MEVSKSARTSNLVVLISDVFILLTPTLTLTYILVMSTKWAGEKTRLYPIATIGLTLIIISGACRVGLDFIFMMTTPT